MKQPTLEEFTKEILSSKTLCTWLGINQSALSPRGAIRILVYYAKLASIDDFDEVYDLYKI